MRSLNLREVDFFMSHPCVLQLNSGLLTADLCFVTALLQLFTRRRFGLESWLILLVFISGVRVLPLCFPHHLWWSLVLADLIDLRVIEFQIFLTIPGSVIQLQWVCVLCNIEWTFCAHERRWFFSREYPPTDSKVLTTTIARVPNRYQPVHKATCFKCSSENQKPLSTRRGHLAYLRGRPSGEPAASPLPRSVWRHWLQQSQPSMLQPGVWFPVPASSPENEKAPWKSQSEL